MNPYRVLQKLRVFQGEVETTTHSHTNKATLDTYDQTNADLTDSVSKKHANSLDHDGAAQDIVISGKTTLVAVKADADIADAISKKHANTLDHSNASDHTQGTDQGLDTGGANAVTAAETKAAYTHSIAAHAPSNAQKNSDITKLEIEAKLIGDIVSHSHVAMTIALAYL